MSRIFEAPFRTQRAFNRRPYGIIHPGLREEHPLALGLFLPFVEGAAPLVDYGQLLKFSNIVGTLKGGADNQYGLYGAFGGSVVLSGSANTAPIPNGSTQFSFVFYLRPGSTMLASTVGGVINRRNAFNSSDEFALGFNFTTGGFFSCSCGTSANGWGAEYDFSTTGWSSTKFQQVICTMDNSRGAGARWRLWRNGTRQSVSAVRNEAASQIATVAQSTEIGRVNHGTLRYNGDIGYLAVFNGLLDPYVPSVYADFWGFMLADSMDHLILNAGGGGGFQPAWASRCNQLLGGGNGS